MLSGILFGQGNLQEPTLSLVPTRLVYQGDSLVAFDRVQEEILIQKLIYKEIYREDVLMWMDLWEKERKQSTYLLEALSKSNKALTNSQALNEQNTLLRKSCEANGRDLYKTNLELSRKLNNNKLIVKIGIPVALITGYLIAK